MSGTKKVYVKPTIEGVHLLPDEAVLGHCKTIQDCVDEQSPEQFQFGS